MGSTEAWDGGYVLTDSRGRKTFYIRKQIRGKRYDLSTRCTSAKAAFEQLKKFEADPEKYARGDSDASAKPPVYLDEDLAREFLTYCRDVKKNSPKWLYKQKGYVAWWADELAGLDLRKLSVTEHIKPALAKAKAEAHRIAALKAIYSWLRKDRLTLTVAEDPTFQTLMVPQAKPEQWKRVKAVARDHFLAARKQLASLWQDAVDIQAGTGWHISELQRFAEGGAIESYPGKPTRGVAGVLVCPQTKGGEPLRTAVSRPVLEAGKRLLARGTLSIEKYGIALKKACVDAGVPEFLPGQFRHSVATWAINQGEDPASVAAFLNHKSPRTTMRFYATHAVPKKVPTLR
jgi:integrase